MIAQQYDLASGVVYRSQANRHASPPLQQYLKIEFPQVDAVGFLILPGIWLQSPGRKQRCRRMKGQSGSPVAAGTLRFRNFRQRLPRPAIPDANCSIITFGSEQPLGRKGHNVYKIRMPFESLDKFAVGQIPYLYGFINTGRSNHLSGEIESHTQYHIGMAFEATE